APKQARYLLGLRKPQQAVIDEHAGELIADRLVDEHGGHRGIHAAREAADYAVLADLTANLLDRLLLERPHGPIAGAAGDLAHEIADEGGAIGRVHDLEMELGGIEPAPLVGDHGDGSIRRGADHLEAG